MEHRQVYPQLARLNDRAVWPKTALWALAITADTCGKSTGGRGDFRQQERPTVFRSGSLTVWSKVIRSSETRQEIPHTLRNLTVQCRVHNSPPRVHVLTKINTVHVAFEIHYNIIFPSTPRSSKWVLSLRIPHKDPVRIFSSSSMHATFPRQSHLP